MILFKKKVYKNETEHDGFRVFMTEVNTHHKVNISIL